MLFMRKFLSVHFKEITMKSYFPTVPRAQFTQASQICLESLDPVSISSFTSDKEFPSVSLSLSCLSFSREETHCNNRALCVIALATLVKGTKWLPQQ